MEGDKSLRSLKQKIKNTSSSETAGMRTKAGANSTLQQNSKIPRFGHLSQAWLLDNHPASRLMLWNFPTKINTTIWHRTLAGRKTSLPTSQCPWRKPRKWDLRKQWPEKDVSVFEVCVSSLLTSVPFQLEHRNSPSNRTECSLQHHTPDIFQPKHGEIWYTSLFPYSLAS